MRKLKVGDKVKINKIGLPGSVNKIGDIGVITEIDRLKHARVQVGDFVNLSNWSKLSDLELIKNKMNKHKKFIKDAYNGKKGLTMCSELREAIEESYPEFNRKPKLDVCQWVTDANENKWLMFYTKSGGRYGFDSNGDWYSCDKTHHTPDDNGRNTKATEEKVKEALISEAKKRGLVDGVVIRSPHNGDTHKLRRTGADYTLLRDSSGSIYMTYFGWVIFKEGKWATIIEAKKQMTVSQLEEELGYEIEIIK
jgi:hypothetical protein